MPIPKLNEGARLEELLRERGISLTDYNRIMEEAGYASQVTRGKFRSPSTDTIDKRDLCLICSLFGFRPEDFGHSSRYFKSEHSGKAANLFCFNHRKEGDKAYRPFIEQFFNEVNRHLLEAESSLYVCDYLDKLRGIEHKENRAFYHEKNKAYYERLEAHFIEKKDSPVQYKRLLQMPLHVPPLSLEEAVELVVEELFPESFRHLCRCLKYFPKESEFYVVLKPFRLHTYYLVDEKVALTEYHRYDKKGTPIPDTLFVNFHDAADPEAVGSIYMKSCLDEFHRMLAANKANRLAIPQLVKSTLSLHEKIVNEIDRHKKGIQEAVMPSQQERIVAYVNRILKDEQEPVPPDILQHLNGWQGHVSALSGLRLRRENVREKLRIISEYFEVEE